MAARSPTRPRRPSERRSSYDCRWPVAVASRRKQAVLKQLLFVDDEPLVLDSFRRSLAGYRGSWAMSFVDSSLDAWQRLTAAPVDLVVSDLTMPGIDGLELLGRMQAREETRDIPMIIVTG